MQARICPASVPPPVASKPMVAPVAASASVSGLEVGCAAVAPRAARPGAQQRRLLGLAHDVDQADAVLQADAVEHLAQVGRRRGVHQRGVAFALHGLDHAQRGERVDEARRTLAAVAPGRQRQALRGLHGAVLRIHGAADAATVRPSSACAAGDAPAATTVPAPSLPTGSDWPTRPAMAFISAGGTWARTTGRSAVPPTARWPGRRRRTAGRCPTG
jgi:hypothetical protein